jgi:hypothetical protein
MTTFLKRIGWGIAGAAIVGGCIVGAIYIFSKHASLKRNVFPCGSAVQYSFDYPIPEITGKNEAVPITIYGYSLGSDWDSPIAKADTTANDTHYYVQWTAFESGTSHWAMKDGNTGKYFGKVTLNDNATPHIFEPTKVAEATCTDISKPAPTAAEVAAKIVSTPVPADKAVSRATLTNPTLYNGAVTSGPRWPPCSLPGSMLKPTKEANLGQDIPACSITIPKSEAVNDPCVKKPW